MEKYWHYSCLDHQQYQTPNFYMLREIPGQRSLKKNLMLASSTASVAGMTNVVGVLAFLSFVSNITGHVATLAGKLTEQNMEEVYTVAYWLFMFFSGLLSPILLSGLSITRALILHTGCRSYWRS
nr:DUF1275 family protein [Chitinophaga pinensis]